MKVKRLLGTMLAMLMLASASITIYAAELPIGYWNIAEPYRYLTFATDGGSYIKALEKPIGEYVSLESYVPTKDGYIFDGWYSDPRTKENRVYGVTLYGNEVVYAKWLDDGTPKPQISERVYLTTEQALAYGNYRDTKTGVPVTALWVQQNARLQELMAEYNAKFNK